MKGDNAKGATGTLIHARHRDCLHEPITVLLLDCFVHAVSRLPASIARGSVSV